MLFTDEEIKLQTRELWRTCFHDSEDFLDIYFGEKYTPTSNVTCRPDGRVVAAAQFLPYRMSLYGNVAHAGYVSGLATSPESRGRGLASQVLREGHRRLYRQGAALSFLIPGSPELRRFYENPRHGAYWTASYRVEEPLCAEGGDPSVEITSAEEWGYDLYAFFRRAVSRCPFALLPAENDFFAALSACDLEGGQMLVARRRRKLAGFCLAAPRPGGGCLVRELAVDSGSVRAAFIAALERTFGAGKVVAWRPVSGEAAGALPYAMARVVHVERFLKAVLQRHPNLTLQIGVDGDLDIPENNGYYSLAGGKVSLVPERPDTVVTPGGLAAMFLAAHPLHLPMMLDE